MVVGKVGRRVLISHQIGDAGEQEIEIVGAVKGVESMIRRSQARYRAEGGLHGLAKVLSTVQEESRGAAGADIKNHGGGVAVKLGGMAAHVLGRSPHALLFAGEEREPDGAPRSEAEFSEAARHVDHHGGIDAVVLSASSEVPG